MASENDPPPWLRPTGIDGFHLVRGFGRGDLVVWPCPGGDRSRTVLDGAFSPGELREIATWIETGAAAG